MSRTRVRSGLAALALASAMALLLSGCFVFHQNKQFAIGTESNRANLVVHVKVTNLLHQDIHARGNQATRQLLLASTPKTIALPNAVRLLCVVNPLVCGAGTLTSTTVLSWWRSDVRNRGDFHEAFDDAGSTRCFAWTFLPSRNFTHKGVGTSGCRR